jgi:predicted methyltransferase
MVKVKPGAKVITIERAQNVLTIERVVELFSTAFEQTCALKVIDGFAVNCLTHELTMAETTVQLEKQKRLPDAFLSDHGDQFKVAVEEMVQ